MAPHDPYEPHKAAIRARGHLVNPWRLGGEVGRAGLDLPCPYTTPRSAKLYRDGLRDGHVTRRLERQRELNKEPG